MSRRRRRELGNAQEATDRIERRRHLHIEVGVHTTSYRARRIYSGHRHPFSLNLLRGGTRRPMCAAPVRSSCCHRAIRRTHGSTRATNTWNRS